LVDPWSGVEGKQGDPITVTWGREVYSPIRYHSFEVGPFAMSSTLSGNETVGHAVERLHGALEAAARVEYRKKLTAYLLRVKEAAKTTRDFGKDPEE